MTTDIELTPKQAADLAVRYDLLKNGLVSVDPATGERFTPDELERETKAINEKLKAYIEHTGEPISVEGLPDLKLQSRSEDTLDLSALQEHEPDIFYLLVSANQLKVNVKKAREVLNPEQVMRFNKAVIPGADATALVFDRKARR